MTELTRVPQSEIERRENYLREYWRPYSAIDPFTWPYSGKAAAATFASGILINSVFNYWYKKPWYFNIYPRAGMIVLLTALGYGMGAMRSYHYRTRDAVLEHYMKLHPQDFIRLKDLYGRPFKDVILPWWPHRVLYINKEKVRVKREE